MELEAGTQVDRYVVEGLLGKGGMAVVYRVRHAVLGHPAALKILLVPSPSIRQRLLQEGRVQSNLRHPNVVAVSDVVDVEGSPGLVMEYIDGPSLDRYLLSHQLSLQQADALARGILRGVVAAHAAGTVHRDLKPGNIMLAIQDGELIPKITDFGLAKALAAEAGGAGATRSGLAMGTPAYMAPEQIRSAKNVDDRADVFSLGAILYELVSGVRAFPGEDIIELFSKIGAGEYTPIEQLVPNIPKRQAAAIAAALQRDPDQRLRSAAALYEAWTGESLGVSRSGSAGPWDAQALAAASSLGSGSEVGSIGARISGGGRASAGGLAPATMDVGLGTQGPMRPTSQETMDPGSLHAGASTAALKSTAKATKSVVQSTAAQSVPSLDRLPPAPAPRRSGGSSWGGGGWMALTALIVSGLFVGAGGLGVMGVGAAVFMGNTPTARDEAAPSVAPSEVAPSDNEVPSAPIAAPAAPLEGQLGGAAPTAPPAPSAPAAREDKKEKAAPVPPSGGGGDVAAPTRSADEVPAPPTPTPTPAPAPVAEPAKPVAAAGTGKVLVKQCVAPMVCAVPRPFDRSILKATDGSEYFPGAVPAGRYELWTGFEGKDPKRTLTLQVEANETVKISCYAATSQCVVN